MWPTYLHLQWIGNYTVKNIYIPIKKYDYLDTIIRKGTHHHTE